MKYLLVIILGVCMLTACTKDEGKGGKSTIRGKIFLQDYTALGFLKDEYYPGEYPVYIIYGDEFSYGDDTKTHFDGSYSFEYLYPGTYTIYAYSKCRTCPGEREIISQEVTIAAGEEKVLEDIVVED